MGFASVSFVAPAAANFSFTAPAGAKVKTVTAPSEAGQGPASSMAGQGQVIGQDWLSVAVLPASALSGLASGTSGAGRRRQAAPSPWRAEHIPVSITKR